MSQIVRIWDTLIVVLHWSLIPLVLYGFIWNFTPDSAQESGAETHSAVTVNSFSQVDKDSGNLKNAE